MKIVKNHEDSLIELTDERWEYIISKHPEVKPYYNEIDSVLIEPDIVKRSKRDSSVLLYYKFFDRILNGKYLLIVVKKDKRNFVVTAYVTDRFKGGEIIWQKN